MSPEDLGPDPVAAFRRWFDEACAADVPTPEAMALATATPDGTPSMRWVLLRPPAGENPFAFFTNLESRKADELAANPRAALGFHWQPLGRQVRVEGTVERLPDDVSDVYFHARPRGSQLAAWVSRQSRPSADRADLERRWNEADAHFAGRDVKRPPHWGGYRLVPRVIEFWEARPNRLHDRVRYDRRADAGWDVTRLEP